MQTICGTNKNGGVSPAVFVLRDFFKSRDQRSSCSTLCCDWLASASAETAIDWRVDSAWLLAASSFGSASVRFDAPVCRTLIRFLLKSWRICTTERFEPRFEAAERSRLEAPCNAVNTLLVALLSMKSVPTTRLERPRPAALKFAPVMLSVEVPVSLNTSFSVSPFKRLMPLNEESCEVVLICDRMLLYCEIKPARVACAAGSAIGIDEEGPGHALAAEPGIVASVCGAVAVAG